jgi:Domain of unknown function (DUF6438)
MSDRFSRPRRRRQGPARFFLTALAIAILIFAVVEIIQHQPWKSGGTRRAPASATQLLPIPADELAGFQLFLRRGGCNGDCPYYALEIENGKLQYVGVHGVAKQGKLTVTVGEEESRTLLGLVEQASFFSLADSYDLADPGCKATRTDAADFTVGVTLNGQTKVIKANEGCTDVPKKLIELADGIDRVTGSAQWTGIGNPPPAGT